MFEVSPPRLHQWHPVCTLLGLPPPDHCKKPPPESSKRLQLPVFPLQKSDEATVKKHPCQENTKQPGLICRSDTVEGAPVEVGSLIAVFSQRVVFTTL